MAIHRVKQTVVDSVADLRTFQGVGIDDKRQFLVSDLNSTTALFRWVVGLTGTDDGQLLVTPTVGAASGRFLRADEACSLKYPFDFNFADNATVFTVPTGLRLLIMVPFLEITTQFTGGTEPLIGFDSSNAAYNTAGDIVGGPNGIALGLSSTDLAVGFRAWIGPKVISQNTGAIAGTGQGPVVLVAGDTIRYNRILNAFTAGAGFLHFPARLIQT